MLVAPGILSLLYNIVDRIYICTYPDIGNNWLLGAVRTLFSDLLWIITAFSNLFGSGGARSFSIERGGGDHEMPYQIMHTSIFPC